MIKNEIVSIKAIQEYGELEGVFGQFRGDDIRALIEKAVNENMSCLAFIDWQRNTYFNTLQCREIIKELEFLRKYKNLNKNLLKAIEMAANFAIENETFIKFEINKTH
jgi:hypothetical protein